MFTGIIETTGQITEVTDINQGRKLSVISGIIFDDIKIGDSIAVNGCCVTVESFKNEEFSVFLIPETLSATNLSLLKSGDKVNLERAMPANGRFGGHIVQGHIEAMGVVTNLINYNDYLDIKIKYKSDYIIGKGSIAIDGISLTVQKVFKDHFKVQIIPETIRKTIISDWVTGTYVNIETDYLLKSFIQISRKQIADLL